MLPEHLKEMKIRSEDYDNTDDSGLKSLDKVINEHYRNSSKGVQMSGNSWQERSRLPSWINGGDGVFWTREPPDASETNGGCDKIKKIVDLLGVKRMVIGHTVQWQGMNSICGGKLVLIIRLHELRLRRSETRSFCLQRRYECACPWLLIQTEKSKNLV